jgi:hypothetical protein
MIFGAALFGKADRPRITVAAMLGGLVPDLSLFLMAGVSIFILDIPPHVVFGKMYFSDGWQQVFAVDNSFWLWGALLAMAHFAKRPVLLAFAGSAMVHLAFDFMLHNVDARMHFWPLSNWVFHSPFSYWDRNHYGQIIGPLELAISLVLCALMWRQFRGFWIRGAVVALALAEASTSHIWHQVF